MSPVGSISSRAAVSAAAAIASAVERLAGERAPRRARHDRPVADAQVDQPRLAAAAALVERHQRRHPDLRVVAVAAGDLHERPAGARRQRRQRDLDQQLVGLQGGGEEAGEEVARPRPSARRRRAASRKRARSATATAGSSAAGSACARLPPTVPRLRICGWAM